MIGAAFHPRQVIVRRAPVVEIRAGGTQPRDALAHVIGDDVGVAATGELADDDHVRAVQHFRLNRAVVHQLRVDLHGAEVGEQADEQDLAEERRHRRFAGKRPLRAGERDGNYDQSIQDIGDVALDQAEA